MAARKEKGQALTYQQKVHLVRLITQNPCVVEKNSDHLKLGKKASAWEKITSDYNAYFPISQPKSTAQLKRSWEYIRNMVKKNKSKYIRDCHKTGGGPPPTPPEPDELTLLAETVMGNDLQPAEEQMDSEDVEHGINILTSNLAPGDDEVVILDVTAPEVFSASPSNTNLGQNVILDMPSEDFLELEDPGESSTTSPSTSPAMLDLNSSVSGKVQCKRKMSISRSWAMKKLRFDQTMQRERTAQVLETQAGLVAQKAVEFLDGALDCLRKITDVVVKKLGD